MFPQQLINGLTLGSVYALVAVGYTMVYGIIQLINFAHGEIYMIGAYLAFTAIAFLHLPFLAALLLSMASCALLGVAIDFVAYRPLRKAPRLAALITAIGMSLFLQNIAQAIWGANTRPFPFEAIPKFFYASAFSLVQVGGATVATVGELPTEVAARPDLTIVLQISWLQVVILAVSLLLMVGLHLIVHRTRIGTAMRACAQDQMMASLVGINVNRVISFTFALGSALGAAAGVLVGVYYNAIFPTMGYRVGVVAFAAAVLGGIGNVVGAILGGLVLGLAEVLGAAYISSEYRYAIAYAIMILVIIFKPSGLMGSPAAERT
ncbi:MAG: branched-chain amino acid ABC transporter permease [bacterium]|jgi:branched-chain amino acid transport system permease protein|nr:branched-chain amino acid ABC transporter permease [bacterium]